MSLQLVLDLRGLTEAEFIAKCATIGMNMAKPEHAALVAGSPFTGAQITALGTAFAAKRQTGIDMKQALKTNTSEKNTAEDAAGTALTLVKKFLEAKPTLTEAQALGLGYDLKAATAPPAIVAPENLSVTFGDDAGSVSAHWNPVAGSSLYLLQSRLANTPGAVWETGYSNTASDCRVTGLTPGALYEFQVLAMFPGRTEPGPASNVVEQRAA